MIIDVISISHGQLFRGTVGGIRTTQRRDTDGDRRENTWSPTGLVILLFDLLGDVLVVPCCGDDVLLSDSWPRWLPEAVGPIWYGQSRHLSFLDRNSLEITELTYVPEKRAVDDYSGFMDS